MSSNSKRYKALILDVDGTILNGRTSLPSERVRAAIKKAQGKLHVGLATSRPVFENLKNIFSYLDLNGPSVVNAGATVIDPRTFKILWEKKILKEDIETVYEASLKIGVNFLMTTNENNLKINKKTELNNVLQMWAYAVEPELGEILIKEISNIPTIAPVRVPSWKKAKIDIVITHASATKHHGIAKVAEFLNIKPHQMIGVGDGYNDFPLLMACGLKVAMGNAVSELKEIADYIAPTVEEDGVADVIEKFIL